MTTVNIPEIKTERLLLRAPVREDFEGYFGVFGDDRSRFMGGPYDRNRAFKEFGSDMSNWIIDGLGYWTIADRADNRYLGSVGFSQPPSFPELEMGWFVNQSAEGQSIAFEAASAARDYVFDTLGFDGFVSYIDPDNDRSMALAERLGAVVDMDAKAPDPGDLVYRHIEKRGRK